MSKTFKRIALVASAALAIGGLSAVSANATVTAQGDSLAISSATSTTTVGVAATTYVTQSYLAGTGADTMTVTATIQSMPVGNSATPVFDSATVTGYTDYNVSYSPNVAIPSKSSLGNVATTGKDVNGTSTVGKYTAATFKLSLTPNKVGTYIVKLVPAFAADSTVATTAAPITWTVTVSDFVGYNSAFISKTKTSAPTVDDDAAILGASTASSTAVARIAVNQWSNAAKTTALDTTYTQAVSVVVTGAGTLGTADGTVVGRGLATAATGAASQDYYVFPDGTTGVGTITITVGSTVVATKTVTFYSTTPATIAATQVKYIAAASPTGSGVVLGSIATPADATTGAVEIKATDTNGNLVSGLTAANFSVTSDNTACMQSVTTAVEETAAGVTAATGNGPGYYLLTVKSAALSASGCSANLTFKYTISSTSSITTAAVPFTTGGTTAYALAFTSDKDSYASGDLVTLTLTAKDKSGNLLADGAYDLFGASYAGLTFSSAVTTAVLATTAAGTTTFKKGVKTATFYAPNITGALSFYGTYSTTAAVSTDLATAAKVTGSITVTNAAADAAQAAIDAAQEATDAANAAYDAANNAMDSADAATAAAQEASDNAAAALAAVTELATTVASLVAKVNSMAATIAKIAKKVKA